MTEKEIVKITDIIMSNSDSFDAVLMLKNAFPRFLKAIEQEEKRHTNNEDFEDNVLAKAKELYVLEGNDRVHFGTKHMSNFSEYLLRARGILNAERSHEDT